MCCLSCHHITPLVGLHHPASSAILKTRIRESLDEIVEGNRQVNRVDHIQSSKRNTGCSRQQESHPNIRIINLYFWGIFIF
jgi:hypothetical protein